MDGDDFFAPEMLERTTLAAREQNADIVLFGGVRYDDATQKVTKEHEFLRRELLPEKPVFSRTDVPNTLFMITAPAPWCKLYARRFLLETGLQFQTLSNTNDAYFTLSSMALAERITTVDADLIYYRVNRPASLQQGKMKDPLCFLEAVNALYQELQQRGLYEQLQTTFRHFGCSTTMYNLQSVRTDEARLQILEALDQEPYCQLPLQEIPGIDDDNILVHQYSLQLAAARNWYHRSEQISLLPQQEDGEQYRLTPPTEGENVQVSVIIPVYNTAPYLDEALGSIANQTLREIEIICINDGSTDGSLEILERWAARDRRFVLFSRPNGGQGTARNLGIAQARGEFIYFMDSDDLLEQEALEQLVAVMREKALDVLFFDGSTFYDSEEMAASFSSYQNSYTRSRAYDDVYEGPTLLRKFCEEDQYSASPCLQILRTDFVREKVHTFLPGILYEDNPFTFEVMLKAKRASHVRQAYFHRRIREGSTMTKAVTFHNSYSYYRCYDAMLQTYYETIDEMVPEDRNAALKRIANTLRNSRIDYGKMPPEYDSSELGMRESLISFQALVCDVGKARRRMDEMHKKLQITYDEKSELNRKLQQTYDEKSELNRKLQITYGEKFDRGVQIKELKKQQKELNKQKREMKKQISALKRENDDLKTQNRAKEKELDKLHRSTAFRIGRALTWPVCKVRALMKRRK